MFCETNPIPCKAAGAMMGKWKVCGCGCGCDWVCVFVAIVVSVCVSVCVYVSTMCSVAVAVAVAVCLCVYSPTFCAKTNKQTGEHPPSYDEAGGEEQGSSPGRPQERGPFVINV